MSRVLLGHNESLVHDICIYFNGPNTGGIEGRPDHNEVNVNTNMVLLGPSEVHAIFPSGTMVRTSLRGGNEYIIMGPDEQIVQPSVSGVAILGEDTNYYKNDELRTTTDRYHVFIEKNAPVTLLNGTVLMDAGSNIRFTLMGNAKMYLK